MVTNMPQQRYADVVLTNARVLTMEPENPMASYVAVEGDKILAVGDGEDVPRFTGPATRQIDCQGMAIVPGFVDAHCHLMALASSIKGVDCRPEKASSISHIIEAIRRRVEAAPTGSWTRAFGYDEFYLAEKRHPNRWDLDRASSFHPVRLDHRTGHVSVLNSRALELLDISRDTPDPVDGVIERDEASGEPTGVLFEMGDYIHPAMEAYQNKEGFQEGMRRANGLLLSSGITSVQDASPGNDFNRWQTFKKLKEEGILRPRVSLMAGASYLQSFLDAGIMPGSGIDDPGVAAVKLVLSLTTGALQPDLEELMDIVLSCHGRGFQLAFHAVEEEAVEAVADALLAAQATIPRPDARHRIEHCSECPPHIMKKVQRSRALVVTQPSFIYHNGEKYLSMVDERLLPHLYPVASLAEAGIPVAAGSDAPIAEPDPLLGIYSAVTRNTRHGFALSPSQAVSVWSALKMHTIVAAYACFEENIKGSIAAGKLADLVLLDHDPASVEPEDIKDIKAMMTMVGGKIVWQR